jgi:hypothetical protein
MVVNYFQPLVTVAGAIYTFQTVLVTAAGAALITSGTIITILKTKNTVDVIAGALALGCACNAIDARSTRPFGRE